MGSTVADERGRRYRLVDRDCPTCGHAPVRELGWRGGVYHRYGKGAATRIVRCRSCGLLFPSPFPVPEDPQEIYGDPGKYFAGRDLEVTIESRRELIRAIRQRTGLEQPRVLDVGSGRGETLAAAGREALDTAVGLELSEAMASSCQADLGVKVRLETIEQHAAGGQQYDAVLLLAVLEHVYDPDAMIAAAARLSHPGSVLLIDCPVEPNLLTRVGNGWNRVTGRRGVYNLSPTFEPYHVFGFNPSSLRRLLTKHGWCVDEVMMSATPTVPANGSVDDHLRAFVGTQLNRIAGAVGQASNMDVWARLG